MRASNAIVIGAGVGGLLAALLLSKRSWSVRLIDEHASRPSPNELPYICSRLVSDFLAKEAPEILTSLRNAGAREISIAEILRSRFPDVDVTPTDVTTSFLCFSRSLLHGILMDHVRRAGLQILPRKIEGLMRNGAFVEGVRLDGGERLEAELVIDATGSPTARNHWFAEFGFEPEPLETAGPGYVSLAKFYRKSSTTPPVTFALASGRNFRGGIYPLENDRFAIALVVPETTPIGTDPQAFFESAIDVIPRAKLWIETATVWDRGLQVVRGIGNRFSGYYDRSYSSRRLLGFFPIGDSVLSGNPIYGRGISFAAAQLGDLATALDRSTDDWAEVHSLMSAGLRRIRRYWADGAFADRADEKPSSLSVRALRFLRDTYVSTVISQLETSPDLTRNFLYNYQLTLPAWRVTRPRHYLNALRNMGSHDRQT